MASALIPAIYDARVADRDFVIRTEDAYLMARRLAREEAMLVSPSAAARKPSGTEPDTTTC